MRIYSGGGLRPPLPPQGKGVCAGGGGGRVLESMGRGIYLYKYGDECTGHCMFFIEGRVYTNPPSPLCIMYCFVLVLYFFVHIFLFKSSYAPNPPSLADCTNLPSPIKTIIFVMGEGGTYTTLKSMGHKRYHKGRSNDICPPAVVALAQDILGIFYFASVGIFGRLGRGGVTES